MSSVRYFWLLILSRTNKNKTLLFRCLVAVFLFILIFRLIFHREHVSTDAKIRMEDDANLKYAKLYQKLNPVVENWGKNGAPVQLTPEQESIAKKSFSSAAFNVFISDRLSPHRSVPDPRPYECSVLSYDINRLGTASVVIIFTNEIWSALTRTVWSVVDRTPRKLLKEIILVDDFSDKFELTDPLDEYMTYHFGDLVKIIRLPERQGLIRARLAGAKLATGDVLVFLDSHCETTTQWLEPMMKVIHDDPSAVVCPVIDIISDHTLEYVSGNRYYFQVGGFIWSGHFTWIDIDSRTLRKNPTSPVKTPTMAGGLFAMNREYFFKIGSYDDKMEIWGGENLEMSFRIWQCGGKLYIHPCSHVGHIFRDYHPYSFLGKDSHGINTVRTVLVWMEDYARYFFMFRDDLRDKANSVDVTERLELKKRLGCKSFRWYLENVYTEKKYIYDQDVQAYGACRNPITNMCIDNLNKPEDTKHQIGVYQCLKASIHEWTNQMLSFMNTGQIRREEGCLMIDEFATHRVVIDKCVPDGDWKKPLRPKMQHRKRMQTWKHHKGGWIQNVHFDSLCLSTESLKNGDDLRAVECNKDDLYQIWWFQKYVDIDL